MGSFLIAALVAGVQLSGEIQCPEIAVVESRLAVLLSAPSDASPDRALLIREPEGVRIELRRADGALIGTRVMAIKDTCDDTAEAIAVTLAAWESQIHNSSLPPVAFPTPPPVPLAPVRHVAPPAVVVRAAPKSRLAWEVEAAFLASIASGAFAAGASAEVYLGKQRFPLGARVGVTAMDSREMALGGGSASYLRAALSLGPTVEVLSKVLRIELHAEVLAGWLFLQGRGFATNNSDQAFDPALGTGVRLSLDRWQVTPYLDVTVIGWLLERSASATEAGVRVSSEIPRLDVWLRAGVAYGRRR